MGIKINSRSTFKAVLFVGILTLTGCVSIPASIQGSSPNPAVNLSSVQNAPEMYIGQEGRFGGKVISVFNQPNKTRLEIAVIPLNKYDATDYCVKFTVLDALKLGYNVDVLTDGCRGVNLSAMDSELALAEMSQKGATLLTTDSLQ